METVHCKFCLAYYLLSKFHWLTWLCLELHHLHYFRLFFLWLIFRLYMGYSSVLVSYKTVLWKLIKTAETVCCQMALSCTDTSSSRSQHSFWVKVCMQFMKGKTASLIYSDNTWDSVCQTIHVRPCLEQKHQETKCANTINSWMWQWATGNNN